MFFFFLQCCTAGLFIAEIMQHLCDGLKFLDKVLSVERATPASSKNGLHEGGSMMSNADEGVGTASKPRKGFQTSRDASGTEPIAPLGIEDSFPPQLEYDKSILLQYGTVI